MIFCLSIVRAARCAFSYLECTVGIWAMAIWQQANQYQAQQAEQVQRIVDSSVQHRLSL